MTIKDLKDAGYHVYLQHQRQYYEFGPQNGKLRHSDYMTKSFAKIQGYPGDAVITNSGRSYMEIVKDDKVVAYAKAICCEADNFNKKRAVQILLGRVEKQLNGRHN